MEMRVEERVLLLGAAENEQNSAQHPGFETIVFLVQIEEDNNNNHNIDNINVTRTAAQCYPVFFP